jgi:hypothetical protein
VEDILEILHSREKLIENFNGIYPGTTGVQRIGFIVTRFPCRLAFVRVFLCVTFFVILPFVKSLGFGLFCFLTFFDTRPYLFRIFHAYMGNWFCSLKILS